MLDPYQAAVPDVRHRGHGERVLVVDDEWSIREVVEDVLVDEGYRVHTEGRFPEALEALRRQAYDVVLADLFGCDIASGLSAVRPLIEAAQPAAVGLFTCHRLDLAAAHAAGFDFIIPKPFDLDDLIRRLAAALSARERA